MIVGALVLAAGQSRRFGADKRLHLLEKHGLGKAEVKPLLQWTLESVQAAGLPVRVCLRDEADLAAGLVLDSGAETLFCDRSTEGMGGTLAQGVAACTDWDGLLVVLGDMAWVCSETYNKLADALEHGGIVRPRLDGVAGNPVGFSRSFYEQLECLEGDTGARDVLSQNRSRVRCVDVDDNGILRDLDHPGA